MSSLRKRVAAALLAALALSCTAALVACGGSGRDVSGAESAEADSSSLVQSEERSDENSSEQWTSFY